MEARRYKDHNDEHPIRIRFWDVEHCLTMEQAKVFREQLDRAIRETLALREADEWAREEAPTEKGGAT
jgi:hypothetical protein